MKTWQRKLDELVIWNKVEKTFFVALPDYPKLVDLFEQTISEVIESIPAIKRQGFIDLDTHDEMIKIMKDKWLK